MHLFRPLLTPIVKVRALNYLLDEISLDGPSVLLTLANLAIQYYYGVVRALHTVFFAGV